VLRCQNFGQKLIKAVRGRNRPPVKKLAAIDLFAGCGGLTAGLKTAGYRVLAAVEIDDRARETYGLNHRDVWLAGKDICDADPKKIMRKLKIRRGELDLLAGCPPCQGFSRIRKRNKARAARDGRNGLIEEFGRFAEALAPKLIMMENVPGLQQHYRFGNLVKHLESLGYTTRVEVMDTADFAVPQRRKRLILAASLMGRPNLAKPRTERKTVRVAIGKLPIPGNSGDGLHDLPENRCTRVQAMIRAIPADGGSRSDLPRRMRLRCHARARGFFDVYGRMSWERVAPTITGGCHNPSKGRFLHPTQHRTITLREAAILQGFRRRYRFNASHGKEAIALMIGNALPPPFIAAHGRALAKGLRSTAKGDRG
jgi:DNA (cytosine-5)-methyltransferase 1